jgi:hypothetical protein
MRHIRTSPPILLASQLNISGQLFMPLDHVGGKLGRAITVPLACANLAYIYYALPESLTPPTEHLRAGPKPVVKYIMAPFSTLMRKGPSRRKVVLLACSIFMYSWTLVSTSRFTFDHDLLSPWFRDSASRWWHIPHLTDISPLSP